MRMKETPQERYFPPVEAAKYLGDIVTERTLANWRSQGRGPKYTKFGPKVAYGKSHLDEYAAANLRNPGAV
jgi:hypothetical protein